MKTVSQKRNILTNINIGAEVGTAKLFTKPNSNIIQFDIHFKNVKPKRYTKSTLVTNIEEAKEVATEQISKEYKHRLTTGVRTKKASTEAILDNYIKELYRRVEEGEASLRGRKWNKKQANIHRYIINNHIRRHTSFTTLERLTLTKIETWVNHLRKTLSDKTIGNVRIVYHDLSRYVIKNGYSFQEFPTFPKLFIKTFKKTKDGKLIEFGYAHATMKDFHEGQTRLLTAIANKDYRKPSHDEHNLFVMSRWNVILLDTGMRPILDKAPLFVDKRSDNFIFFKRSDKTYYIARGQQASMKAVDELEAYYKANNIKNESLIVNKYGFNYNDETIRTVKTTIMKVMGWRGKKDSSGRNFVHYSLRHCHIINAVEQEEDIVKLAKRVGNSVDMIMKYYYKHNYYREYETPTPFSAEPYPTGKLTAEEEQEINSKLQVSESYLGSNRMWDADR